jgi:hypothetical protein
LSTISHDFASGTLQSASMRSSPTQRKKDDVTYLDFLDGLLTEDLASKQRKRIAMHVQIAHFPVVKKLAASRSEACAPRRDRLGTHEGSPPATSYAARLPDPLLRKEYVLTLRQPVSQRAPGPTTSAAAQFALTIRFKTSQRRGSVAPMRKRANR